MGGHMSNQVGRNGALLAWRILLWGGAVPLAIPVVVLVMFLIAARWVIYFLTAVFLMVLALGSKDYVNYFWLAFFIPFFVGGLLDGIVLVALKRGSN